jgi:DNA polymerase-3 subunit delta'
LLDLLSLSAAGGGRKVAVVDSLDEIEEEGVATLLKSLEEPPPHTTFLVLAGGVDRVPDTILSRCQRVRFRPLAPEVVRELLLEALPAENRPGPGAVELLVRLAQGSVGRAVRGARIGLHEQAPLALQGLLRPAGPRGVGDACAWVHEAGRDLAEQRVRARELLALTLLLARDRAAASGRVDELDAVLPALASGFESVAANVSPDLVLHAVWAKVARARR